MKKVVLLFLLCLVAMAIPAWSQTQVVFPLTAPYSEVRGHYAQPKYKVRRKKNERGQTYFDSELVRVKYARTPPVNTLFFAEAMAGDGYNPFLYQSNTAGLQAGVQMYNQFGGFYMQLAGVYDRMLPDEAIAESVYPFAYRTRFQTGTFFRWAHYNSSTNRGGMLLLDGLVNLQTEGHAEAGIAYFYMPRMKVGTSRYGGWNRQTHGTGKKRTSQWVNLPSSYLFDGALGVEVRMSQVIMDLGLQPYRELVSRGLSGQIHYVKYARNDGWGLLEDVFNPRWIRYHLSAGYSRIPRQILFPNSATSAWSTDHTLQMAFVDWSTTISYARFYRPNELTLGATLRFMDTQRYQEVNGDVVRVELSIPETPFQAYIRYRITSHQL